MACVFLELLLHLLRKRKPRLAACVWKKSEEELRDQGLLGGGALVPPAVLSRQCGSDARRLPPPVEANAQHPQQCGFCFRTTQAH